MSRIRKAYATRFRWLLENFGARRLDQGVTQLLKTAERISAAEKIPLADALTRLHNHLASNASVSTPIQLPDPIRFFCDAGLGGLARWLRAAGYEAEWEPGIDDSDLLAVAGPDSSRFMAAADLEDQRAAFPGVSRV